MGAIQYLGSLPLHFIQPVFKLVEQLKVVNRIGMHYFQAVIDPVAANPS